MTPSFGSRLRDLAAKTGLEQLLIRTGLKGSAATLLRMAQHPRSALHPLELERDYRSFRSQYGSFLSKGRGDIGPDKPDKKVLFVSLTDWVWQIKIEALLAKALELKGCSPVFATYSWCKGGLKYYRVCGFDQFVLFDKYLPQGATHSIKKLASDSLQSPVTIQSIKHLQFRGVNVGRQALASVTRSLHRSGDLSDPRFLQLLTKSLVQSMKWTIAAERLLDEVRPEVAFFLDKDYVGIGSIYDLALNRGIDAIQWCGAHRDDAFTLKRFTSDTRHVHPQSLSKETWELARSMSWTTEREEELVDEFKSRYEDGQWGSYYNRPYGALKHRAEIERELGLDPRKKTAVIFSHILWDSTFFWGEDLFDDYADWLVETVKAACANSAVNWIVKLHPANAWKLKRERVGGELYDLALLRSKVGNLPDHVRLLEPEADINTYSLFEVTDYCLTVRGTVGIEVAWLGIPVLTAGTGRYSNLGFTIDSSTREEYLDRLAHIQHIPRLEPQQVELAKKYAYALFKWRPWQVSTFETLYMPLVEGGHPLDHNIRVHATSLQDIANASDLLAFAEWVTASDRLDFLVPKGHEIASGVHPAECRAGVWSAS